MCSRGKAHCGELPERLQLLNPGVWPDRQREDLHHAGRAARQVRCAATGGELLPPSQQPDARAHLIELPVNMRCL